MNGASGGPRPERGGYFPARRASRLDPALVLRE